MRNVSVLILVTVLAVVGYYVGTAVAKSHKTSDMVGDTAVVIEEDYAVVVPDEEKTQTLKDMNNNMQDRVSEKKDDEIKKVTEHKTVQNAHERVKKAHNGANMMKEAVW